MAGKYMTTEQVAERWLCTPRHVRSLIAEGQLSAVRLGGWKIRSDEVLRYEKVKEKADVEALRQQRIGYIV